MHERVDHTFISSGTECAGWLYRPEGAKGDVPCVVMAHGFSLTRGDGLPYFAERFARAGLATFVFDYRFLGDSGGQPRQRIRQPEQRIDWLAAYTYAAGIEGVDSSRMAVWGYSMSGGHLAHLLGHGRIKPQAALFLAPFVDGLKRVLSSPPRTLGMVFPRALVDSLGRHHTIPATGEPGELGCMTLPGEAAGFARAVPEGSRWRDEASPGVFTAVALHRPWKKAKKIECPIWVGRGEQDITVDPGAVKKLADRAPRGQFHAYEGDHFDLIAQEAERIADDQAAFLGSCGIGNG